MSRQLQRRLPRECSIRAGCGEVITYLDANRKSERQKPSTAGDPTEDDDVGKKLRAKNMTKIRSAVLAKCDQKKTLRILGSDEVVQIDDHQETLRFR